MKGFYGCPNYMAPEVLAGSYDEKYDVWSIGVMLYTLILNKVPFDGVSD